MHVLWNIFEYGEDRPFWNGPSSLFRPLYLMSDALYSRYTWGIYGVYSGYTRGILGVYMWFTRGILGILGSYSREYSGYTWCKLGVYSEYTRGILKDTRPILRVYLGCTRGILGVYLGYTWGILGEYWGYTWVILGPWGYTRCIHSDLVYYIEDCWISKVTTWKRMPTWRWQSLKAFQQNSC